VAWACNGITSVEYLQRLPNILERKPEIAIIDIPMKEKTSVTLSPEVLAGIDRLAGKKHSRSAVIERVLRKYLREQVKAAAEASDLAILNDAADRLNMEAADVLDYQAPDE
jgi:Arc/MetJ-type ribon-helix-helix transcriptional regulator